MPILKKVRRRVFQNEILHIILKILILIYFFHLLDPKFVELGRFVSPGTSATRTWEQYFRLNTASNEKHQSTGKLKCRLLQLN